MGITIDRRAGGAGGEGIYYEPYKFWITASSVIDGDEAWQRILGLFDPLPQPTNPWSYAKVIGGNGGFLTLVENNFFGNTSRFTNLSGNTPVGLDIWHYDHLIGYQFQIRYETWIDARDLCVTAADGSFMAPFGLFQEMFGNITTVRWHNSISWLSNMVGTNAKFWNTSSLRLSTSNTSTTSVGNYSNNYQAFHMPNYYAMAGTNPRFWIRLKPFNNLTYTE
jgi:hypothetical protein